MPLRRMCPVCGSMYELTVNICSKDKTSLMQEPPVPVDDQGNVIREQEVMKRAEESPEPRPASVPSATVVLRATLRCEDPPLDITLNHNAVIGREGTILLDGFPNAKYLSRRHARFTNEPDGWHIQVEPDPRRAEIITNRTSVNGKDVPFGKKVLLRDGDQIVLANIHFIFKVYT